MGRRTALPDPRQRQQVKFGTRFDDVATGTAIKILRTPIRAPNANAFCERFLRSARAERLDHVLIRGEDHLRFILRRYGDGFNDARPHQGVGRQVPSRLGVVVEIPALGGLHYDYRRAT